MQTLIDRVAEVATLRRICDGSETKAVVVWGLAGQGKSTLLQYFRDVITFERSMVCDIVDLEALVEFERQDVADDLVRRVLDCLVRIAEKWFHRQMEGYWSERSRQDDELERLVSSPAPFVEVRQKAAFRSAIRDVRIRVEPNRLDEQIATMRVHHRRRLTEALGAAAVDAARKSSVKGAWFCFDTTERLHFLDSHDVSPGSTERALPVKHWLTADLVPQLARGSIRIVLAGRERLELPTDVRTEHVQLTEWSREDTASFLRERGLADAAGADSVHDACGGHPLWTGVAAEALLSPGPRGRNEARLNVLPAASARPTPDWTRRLLLGRLAPRARPILMAAAVLRRVEKSALAAVLAACEPSFLTGRWFEELTEYSFIRVAAGPDGRPIRRLHPLVREAVLGLLQEEEPRFLQAVHELAETFFMTEGQDAEALYHGLSRSSPQALVEWQGRLRASMASYDFQIAQQLVELATPGGVALGRGRFRDQIRKEAYLSVGRMAFFQRRYAPAEEALSLAAEIADLNGDRSVVAAAKLQLGEMYHRRLDLDRAVDAVSAALELFRQEGSVAGEADSFLLLAHVRFAHFAVAEATEYVSGALERYRTVGDPRGEARALELLGAIRLGQAQLLPALECVEPALALYRRVGDLRGEASASSLLADVSLLLGDTRQALIAADVAMGIHRRTGDAFREVQAVHVFGLIFLAAGDILAARAAVERELEIHRESRNALGIAGALHLLGLIHLELEETSDARRAAGESLQLYRDAENPLGEGHALVLLGRTLLASGDLDAAVSSLGSALVLYERIGNPMGAAECRLRLAEYWRSSGDLTRAVESAQEGLRINEQLGARGEAAHGLVELGRCYLEMDSLELARQHFKSARRAYRDIGDQRSYRRLQNIFSTVLDASEEE
jgi:tetratricopeptide (TPR) repeat protein